MCGCLVSSNSGCVADFNVGSMSALSHSSALGRRGLEGIREVEWLIKDRLLSSDGARTWVQLTALLLESCLRNSKLSGSCVLGFSASGKGW